MKKKEITKLKIKDEIVCAPRPYQGIPDISDDYDVSAMLLEVKEQRTVNKIMRSINCEEDYRYGPSTGYKGTYSYNRDN